MGKGQRKGPVRTLAVERADALRQQRQRERARRWQTERLHRVIDRIERGGIREVPKERIDAIFATAGSEAQPRRTRAAARR